MVSVRGVAPVLAVLALSLSAAPAWGEPSGCRVTLYEDGWALVTVTWNSEGLVSAVPLLPGARSILVTDEGGGLPEYNVTDGTLIVLESPGSINVTYETQGITSKEGDVWTANLSVELGTCEVIMPRGSILVGMSELPAAVTSVDNRTVVFMETPCWVSYVMATRSRGPQAGRGSSLWPAAAAGLALAAAILALSLRTRRRETRERPPLSYDDIALLRKLDQMGGEAYLSELRAALEMPKTTVWRRARRLSEGGLVEMVKTSRGSLLRITEEGRRVIS